MTLYKGGRIEFRAIYGCWRQSMRNSPRRGASVTSAALPEIERVEEELIGAVRLAAPLRTEPKQNHMPLAILGVESRDFALDPVRSGKVTALKRRAVARITRQDRTLERRLDLKRRTALEHDVRLGRESGDQGIFRIFDMDPHQTAGTEELIWSQAGQYVGHRELQLFDGEKRSIIERNQSAAGGDEIAQSVGAVLADASRVALRNHSGPIAL